MKRGLTPPAEGSSEEMPWKKNPKEVCRERCPTVVAQEDRLGYLAYRCLTVTWAGRRQFGRAGQGATRIVDRIHDEVISRDPVKRCHVERGSGRPLLDEAADMKVTASGRPCTT